MTGLQILTTIASILAIVMAVLNLVAYVREKDPDHLRAGLRVLAVVAVLALILAFPLIAPATAHRLALQLPESVRPALSHWLAPEASPSPTAQASPVPTGPALRGSFTIRISRNVLGGIDEIPVAINLADLSGKGARVLTWRLTVQQTPTSPPRTFDGVLKEPLQIPAGGTAAVELELEGEARAAWLAREKESRKGALQMQWEGLDGGGQPVQASSAITTD